MEKKFFRWISPFRGMPVDDKGSSSSVGTVTNETVQLYYYNNGVLTVDGGRPVGEVVVGKLAFDNILNALGSAQGVPQDRSLSFVSTALMTEVAKDIETYDFPDGSSGSERAAFIAASLTNGQYCVDYAQGLIYGKKASTTATLTSTTYKFKQAAAGGTSATPAAVIEQNAARAEDNANQVIAIAVRPLIASTYAWTMDRSIGAVTKRNVKPAPGAVGRLFASNRNAALRYFHIFAKATAPVNGDVPLESYEIPANNILPLDINFGFNGMPVATGISWGISTTNATFTDSATASEHNVYLGWV